jgi:prolyl-tRNA synthetase
VLVPIYRKEEERAAVLEAAQKISKELKIKLDDREGQTPGAKFFHWERLGVPVVMELGPRDLASGNIVLKRRDTGAKEIVPQAEAAARLETMLTAIQQNLYDTAKTRMTQNVVLADSMEQIEEILSPVTAEKGGGKFVLAHLKDDVQSEERLKEFKATIRCIPLVDEWGGAGKCLVTGERVEQRVVVAKAY